MPKTRLRPQKVLSAEDMRLLKLVLYGHSTAEIAKRLNSDKNTIMEQAARVLKRLAAQIET